jgi:hypothetical protein
MMTMRSNPQGEQSFQAIVNQSLSLCPETLLVPTPETLLVLTPETLLVLTPETLLVLAPETLLVLARIFKILLTGIRTRDTHETTRGFD